MRFLASQVMEDYKNASSYDLKETKKALLIGNENISSAIIHKAKNKEEYKKMCEYAELLSELTDIDLLIAKKEKEEQVAIQEQQLREQNRQELTAILRKINDYAQENVSGKKLVKEIEFREKNI